MERINYSVIIRTMGTAGEKYRMLLDSIKKLEPQPEEVVVVLPEGYGIPEDKLGCEKFMYSKKGMVYQRFFGVDNCSTEYALICDDDVCFGSDFVQKLYQPLRDGLGDFSAGPLYSFLPQRGIRALLCVVMASAVPTLLHKETRYVSVLKTTGYSYNRKLKSGMLYESQSVAGTCFFARISALHKLNMLEEDWMERKGYAAMEDQTLFYKGWLKGYKTIVVADAYYEHMDARTSTRNNKPSVAYSSKFNRIVFWHRFIYSCQKTRIGKLSSRLAFTYCMTWERLMDKLAIVRGKLSQADLDAAKAGYAAGWEFIKSNEYLSLSPILEEKSK